VPAREAMRRAGWEVSVWQCRRIEELPGRQLPLESSHKRRSLSRGARGVCHESGVSDRKPHSGRSLARRTRVGLGRHRPNPSIVGQVEPSPYARALAYETAAVFAAYGPISGRVRVGYPLEIEARERKRHVARRSARVVGGRRRKSFRRLRSPARRPPRSWARTRATSRTTRNRVRKEFRTRSPTCWTGPCSPGVKVGGLTSLTL
jgi:hypothetical protein